jgi:hypothetical protein
MDPNLPVTTPQQLKLDLQIAAEREIDGVGMGVLSDGAPFLTLRGLARMCGVDHTAIVRITSEWQENPLKPRIAKIRDMIRAQGADDSVAFVAVPKAGVIHHAVPAAVCMAVLEYYAFEAKSEGDRALNNFRILARKGFRDFVYAQVGYNPTGDSGIAWRQFHDRVSLNYHTVPDGYFSIFKEIADMFVTLLRAGAELGSTFVPDISVGQHWSKYWTSENLDVVYGPRKKYNHNYPAYFPQSASNPQTPYCYPDDALGEFRKWVREHYFTIKLPVYLSQKVRDGHIPAPKAQAAIEALTPKAITANK